MSGSPLPEPAWQALNSLEELAAAQAAHPLLLVLWGGAHCGVCQAIKPKLLQALAARSAQPLPMYDIDCSSAPAVCAQTQVFSLPVLRVFAHGHLAQEYLRAFSVQQVMDDVARLQQAMGAL